LGAENSISWELIEDGAELARRLKKEGFEIIALEQHEKSVDYKQVAVKDKTLIILGNEVEGVSSGLIALADTIAEIPLKGKKESLNVSVAAGVFLYRLLDK
jgi:tRNA G18 (ribose-2'-O)-methylase SpoU